MAPESSPSWSSRSTSPLNKQPVTEDDSFVEESTSLVAASRKLTDEQLECFRNIKSLQDGSEEPLLSLPEFSTQRSTNDIDRDGRPAYNSLKPWQTRVMVLHPESNATPSQKSFGEQSTVLDNSNDRAIALRKSDLTVLLTIPQKLLRFERGEVISNIDIREVSPQPDTEAESMFPMISPQKWCLGDNEKGERGFFLSEWVQFEEAQLSRIKCDLLPVDIINGRGFGLADTDIPITYEAVSYAWGDPTPTCLITVNGKDFLIARELANALLYLRNNRGGKKRYLWCDGICINQRDLNEKAHQVKNMLRIFEKAEEVIAWLGLPTRNSGPLFNACRQMAEENEILEKMVEPLVKQAMDDLLSRSWFFRTWVRQEVFAAKKMIVQVGYDQHEFGAFASWITRIDKAQSSRFAQNINDNIPWQRSAPPTFFVYQEEYQHSGTDRYDFKLQGQSQTFTQHWLSVLRAGALFDVSDERDR
jgi:hypothetical protein